MRWIKTVGEEIFGLFVDNAGYAGAILGWVVVIGLLAHSGAPSVLPGPGLVLGLAVILAVGALRRAGR